MPDTTRERLTRALADRYAIVRQIGEGGMATVYLADDLKHGRNVALKVLKPELAAVVGAERFLAEIRTTANLQHPHILPLFDSGEADGFLFYVMPYVEGETLAERLAREKQLPVDVALDIARSVAGALETAHEAGVIHRDIKPANILLSRGQPLVSDFGIALALGGGGARLTETGLSVGSPYYMSPEQATGDQAVGPAADIYALACVLYEMLVGEPPYVGSTAQAVLGKIIQGLPVSATAVRNSVPVHVDAAIRKALEKLPADRFTRADDFARALSDPAFRHGGAAGHAAAPVGPAWKRHAWPAVAVLALLVAVFGWLRPEEPEATRVERFNVEIPGHLPNVPMVLGTVAADGSAFAFLGYDGQRRMRVYLKEAAESGGRMVQGLGLDDVGSLAFSPDGVWLGVSTFDGRLLKVSRSGGGATVLADLEEGGAIAWLEDDAIVVALRGRIVRVPDDGGPPEDIPLSDPQATVQHMSPLPGDRGFLYVQGDAGGPRDLWAFDGHTREIRRLKEGVMGAWYGGGGLLVLAESGGGGAPALTAARFDLRALRIEGASVGLAEPVGFSFGFPDMWLSPSGTLLYSPGTRSFGRSELVWVDRSGTVSPVDPGFTPAFFETGGLRLSPEGSRVTMDTWEENSSLRSSILVKRLPDLPATRVTFDEGGKRRPVWHPEGTSILYVGQTAGSGQALFQTRADGTGAPTLLFQEERSIFEGLWSPDGRWLVYRTDDETAADRGDIMGIRLGVDSVPVPLIATPAEETSPAISPDGKWIAYSSAELDGQKNVFVQPFPNVGDGRWQISSAGGIEPAWSPDGDEIFFWTGLGPGDEMRVARVDTRGGFVLQSVTTLFKTPPGVLKNEDHRLYDVAPDGKRFLMVRPLTQGDWGLVLVRDFFQVAREALGG